MHLCGIAGFVGTKNYQDYEASALLKLMSDSFLSIEVPTGLVMGNGIAVLDLPIAASQ